MSLTEFAGKHVLATSSKGMCIRAACSSALDSMEDSCKSYFTSGNRQLTGQSSLGAPLLMQHALEALQSAGLASST